MNRTPRPHSSTSPFSISIVIPTIGRSPHLRGLLERLQRQVTNFKFEILIVANIPQQPLRNLVNSMGSHGNATFEYLETGRLGVNLARNKGLDRARASIVLFLDDDAILENDSFVAAHEERHRRYPNAVAIGGPYRLTPTSSVWDRAYHEIAHEWLLRHTMSGARTTQLLGGNMSVKKAELEKNRWSFDEEISFGGAETGLCLRIANANREMYFFEDLEIGHAPEMSRAILQRKAYLQGAGAHWRSKKLPMLDRLFANEFMPRPLGSDPALASDPARDAARRLYRAAFEFGSSHTPFNDSTRTAPPTFRTARFYLFLLFRMRPMQRLRRWHRDLYTTVRTAWINGEKSRPPSTRSGTAPRNTSATRA